MVQAPGLLLPTRLATGSVETSRADAMAPGAAVRRSFRRPVFTGMRLSPSLLQGGQAKESRPIPEIEQSSGRAGPMRPPGGWGGRQHMIVTTAAVDKASSEKRQ